jgi:hypothetical protein
MQMVGADLSSVLTKTTYSREHTWVGRSFQLWVICILTLVFISACQPEATPVANVMPPTATTDIIETLAPPIHYVLGANIQNMDSIRDEIAQSALLIPASGLTEESLLGTDYDIIADYGLIDGWQQSPVVPTVSLIINPNLAPLNDEPIANIIRNGVDGVRIVNRTNISGTLPLAISTIRLTSLKTEFANMGYPDGFELQIGVAEIPHHDAIVNELNGLNLELQITQRTLENIATQLTNNRLHFALIKWNNVSEKAIWTSAVGEMNVIDLYQLPISYLASPELTITFTDNGFPIASY